MTDKGKKCLIGLLCAIVAMFLWIFVAVGLTGGREVENFTDSDKIIMTVFAVVEIATAIVVFLFAVLLGNEQGKHFRQQVHAKEINRDKNTQRRGTALLVLAFTAAFGAMIGGIVLSKESSTQLQNLSRWLLGISIAVAAAVLLLSIVLKKWYVGRFENRQVSQVYQFIYSHRDRAEQTAARKLSLLKMWRRLTGVYALVLGVLGLCVALCGGILYSGGSAVPLCFVAALLIMCTFSQIRFPVSQNIFYEDKAYISEEQYPQLYAIAKKSCADHWLRRQNQHCTFTKLQCRYCESWTDLLGANGCNIAKYPLGRGSLQRSAARICPCDRTQQQGNKGTQL